MTSYIATNQNDIFFYVIFFFLNVNIGSDNISVILVPTLPKNVILVFR